MVDSRRNYDVSLVKKFFIQLRIKKMSKAIENLLEAQKLAMRIRPKVGGFPVIAETLRLAGVTRNVWTLHSCQSLYLTKHGPVIQPGIPLINQTVEVAPFSQEALIGALCVDQAGESTFLEFLNTTWRAGIINYDVDLENRKVTYFGACGESYSEFYLAVVIQK